MRRAVNRYILLFYLLLIAVIIVYRINLLGIGDAIAHAWPPLIGVMAVLALLVFFFLAVRTILHFSY